METSCATGSFMHPPAGSFQAVATQYAHLEAGAERPHHQLGVGCLNLCQQCIIAACVKALGGVCAVDGAGVGILGDAQDLGDEGVKVLEGRWELK